MRRALLRAGQVLRRGARAAGSCGEFCAASGPAGAAAAGWQSGGDAGWSGRSGGMPWALQLQAHLHVPAAALQQATHDGSGSAGRATSSNSAAAAPRKRGRPASPMPDVDAEQLLRSLGLTDTAGPAELLNSLSKLPGVRQQGVLDNAAAVVAHLRSPAVVLMPQQVGQLLERCPKLFSWPVEQRAAVLFGELKGVGVTETAAMQCFVSHPTAAGSTTFVPGLAELAAILAHSEDRDSSLRGPRPKVPAAQRTVAALLTQTPSAVRLVCQRAGYLQQRAAALQQAGFTPAQVAGLAWDRPELLCRDAAAKVASSAAVLQQELDLPAAEVISLAARRKSRWLSSSVDALRERAVALAEGFGRDAAAAMVCRQLHTLNCKPAIWQRNLCCMAACGVADPKAVVLHLPLLLTLDHTSADFLQRRLLLQRAFQLTAAQLYERHYYSLSLLEIPKLAQRLQFVEHCGQAHRLVAKSSTRGKPAAASAEEWRPALTLVAVTGKLDRFLAAVVASPAEWKAWAAVNPPAACPLYSWAQQAAADEVTRLVAALPPELAGFDRNIHRRYRRTFAI